MLSRRRFGGICWKAVRVQWRAQQLQVHKHHPADSQAVEDAQRHWQGLAGHLHVQLLAQLDVCCAILTIQEAPEL